MRGRNWDSAQCGKMSWKDLCRKEVSMLNWAVGIRSMLTGFGKRFRTVIDYVANRRFLIEWLRVRGKDQRQYWAFTAQHEEIMRHTYFYYYTHTWSHEHCRDAMARIPCVFQVRTYKKIC